MAMVVCCLTWPFFWLEPGGNAPLTEAVFRFLLLPRGASIPAQEVARAGSDCYWSSNVSM